jgi:pantetheine-phosphate adenylyltransferase
MDALVVSKETVPGAEAINRNRLVRGFKPLEIVVVGLVGEDGSSKLSSTALRESQATAAAAATR